MKNTALYEEERKKAFEAIKYQRDPREPEAFSRNTDVMEPTRQMLFHFKDDVEESYDWIISQAEKSSYEMLQDIFESLINKYDVKAKVIMPRKNMKASFIMGVFSCIDETLYLIQSIDEKQINKQEIMPIIQAFGVKNIKRVALIHEYAYRLFFNHNNDESDCTRGTGLYSLKDLFENLFPQEDYEVFREFEKNYTKDVREYLGYQLVKTLTPNALFSFKKTVEYSIVSFPYEKHINDFTDSFPSEIFNLIKTQYITKKYYKSLIGKTEFAQSFITAEWLYGTMQKSGKIDYTAVAMGYFKAIEQLLFEIVKSHVDEGRTIKKNGDKGYAALSSDNITNETIDTTLGALISFLRYFPNRDLFRSEIRLDEKTQEKIIDFISLAKGDRNGYFHKDNIESWDYVENVRKQAYIIMFLLLGAYEYTDVTKALLNIPEEYEESDYEKLCSFIHYNRGHLFYICISDEEFIPVVADADNSIQVNEYGDVVFSGVYFRRMVGVLGVHQIIPLEKALGGNMHAAGSERYTEANLPLKICLGEMTPLASGMEFSGPLKIIYNNGNYNIPEQHHKPSY